MNKSTMTDGSPITQDHREIDQKTGMQKGYVVLSAEERSKGFIRPVRDTYVHDVCTGVTTMAPCIAETFARDPAYYTATYCSVCKTHNPVGASSEFTWMGTNEKVGQ